MSRRQLQEMPVKGPIVGSVGWSGDLCQFRSVPLKEDSTRAKNRRTSHYDHLAITFHCGRCVVASQSNTVNQWEIRTRLPLLRRRVVDRGVTGTASGRCSGCED